MTWIQFIRWFFLIGFVFLLGVGMWAIVAVTRMQREQAIALAVLRQLAARSGLKEKIDAVQGGRREDDPPCH